MGGHSIALCASLQAGNVLVAAAGRPDDFRAATITGVRQRHDASFIAKRRNRWASPDRNVRTVSRSAAVRGVAARGPAGLLRVRTAARRAIGYVLACPPAVEASIYAVSNAPDANLYPLLERIEQPVTVMRGGIPWNTERFDLAASPTAPDLAEQFAKGRDICLQGRSHYIPMESPELVAEEIRRLIGRDA